MFLETLTRRHPHCFSEDSETVAYLTLFPSSTVQGHHAYKSTTPAPCDSSVQSSSRIFHSCEHCFSSVSMQILAALKIGSFVRSKSTNLLENAS